MLIPPTNPASTFYEMVLLQFTPDATSEERINIGVVALDTSENRLHFRIDDRYARLREIYPDLDGMAFRNIARGIRSRCRSVAADLESDQLGIWRDRTLDHLVNRIVVPGSANFRWSTTRFGACDDLEARVAEVFVEYVDRLSSGHRRQRVTSDQIWTYVTNAPRVHDLLQTFEHPRVLSSSNLSLEFRGSWMNGKIQVAQPISLDFIDPDNIVAEAAKWSGYTSELSRSNEFQMTALVNDRPDDSRRSKHDQAVGILKANSNVREVVTPSTADLLASAIASDLDHE